MAKENIKIFNFGLNCNIAITPPWDCLHRHDEIEMSFFMTKKPVLFRIGGQVLTLHRNSTILFWGTIPHQILAIEPEVMHYYITIPPHVFISWDLPASLTRGILSGSIFIEKDKNLRNIDIASFPVWLREALDNKDPQRYLALGRSMEARIRRFGGSTQSIPIPFVQELVPSAHTSVVASKTFLRIVDYITHHYKTDFRVDDIAKEVNLHPNYVITKFRKESGINITRYALMLRIYESQRLLLTTDMKIIDIAMEVGFQSISNFYKYFKRICGKNPKDYRKTVKT